MRHLGYLASSVTVVTSLLMHSRLLCGRGFKGMAAVAERKKEGLTKSTFSHDSKLQLKRDTPPVLVPMWFGCTNSEMVWTKVSAKLTKHKGLTRG